MKKIFSIKSIKNIGFNKLILFLLIGVLLIIISLPVTPSKKISNSSQSNENNSNSITYDSTYEENMEERLKKILGQIEGVGDVEVMVRLKASEEKVVKTDLNVSGSSVAEQDKEGGSRNSNSEEKSENTVLVGNSGSQEPYVVQKIEPIVEGVVVIAQGGDSPTIVSQINEALQALFDIPTHKIKVLKKQA